MHLTSFIKFNTRAYIFISMDTSSQVNSRTYAMVMSNEPSQEELRLQFERDIDACFSESSKSNEAEFGWMRAGKLLYEAERDGQLQRMGFDHVQELIKVVTNPFSDLIKSTNLINSAKCLSSAMDGGEQFSDAKSLTDYVTRQSPKLKEPEDTGQKESAKELEKRINAAKLLADAEMEVRLRFNDFPSFFNYVRNKRTLKTYQTAYDAFRYLAQGESIRRQQIDINNQSTREGIAKCRVAAETITSLEELEKYYPAKAEDLLHDVLNGQLTNETLEDWLIQQKKIEAGRSLIDSLESQMKVILKNNINDCDRLIFKPHYEITLYLDSQKTKRKFHKIPLVIVAQPDRGSPKQVIGVEIFNNEKEIKTKLWKACLRYFHYFLIAVPDREELPKKVYESIPKEYKQSVRVLSLSESSSSPSTIFSSYPSQAAGIEKRDPSEQGLIYRVYASLYHHEVFEKAVSIAT
jgi:hypothetical protein